MRIGPSLLLPIHLAIALALSNSGTAFASGQPAMVAGEQVSISQDRQSLRVTDANADVLVEYSLGEWRSWAEENLLDHLDEPVRIGEQVMTPSRFDMFGTADLSPTGELLAFTATAYAILTTVSVVTILDVGSGEIVGVVAEPAFGSVEEIAWSPSGDLLAYSLGTARAGGDGLRVDDLQSLRSLVDLDGQHLLDAAAQAGQQVQNDSREWLPSIRNLTWTDEGLLEFVSSDPGASDSAGSASWSLAPREGELGLR